MAGLFAGGRNATARTAYETLKAALADQATWTQRAASAKELLAAMLASRRNAAKLALEYDIRYVLIMLVCPHQPLCLSALPALTHCLLQFCWSCCQTRL